MRVLFSILMLIGLCSCEREIDINYRTIDPLYVVEGGVGSDSSSVIITRTCDMAAAEPSAPVTNARVWVDDGVGGIYPFTLDADGLYRSSLVSEAGRDYTLVVEVGEERFSATSHAYAAPIVSPLNLTPQVFMDEFKMLFCSFIIVGNPLQPDYYRYRLSINGGDARWNVINDMGADGGNLFQFMPLIKKVDGEMVDVVDGDTVRLDVQAIDRSAYDYYTSLNISSSSASNPISNMSGGALGYFSATTGLTTYHYIDFDGLN